MVEIPAHILRPRPHHRRYLDGSGFIRAGRPIAAGPLLSERTLRRIDWLRLVERLPAEHPSGFEDIRGACCGK